MKLEAILEIGCYVGISTFYQYFVDICICIDIYIYIYIYNILYIIYINILYIVYMYIYIYIVISIYAEAKSLTVKIDSRLHVIQHLCHLGNPQNCLKPQSMLHLKLGYL